MKENMIPAASKSIYSSPKIFNRSNCGYPIKLTDSAVVKIIRELELMDS